MNFEPISADYESSWNHEINWYRFTHVDHFCDFTKFQINNNPITILQTYQILIRPLMIWFQQFITIYDI